MEFRNMQKIFMKIATFLVALSIVVVIALLFFRHQIINRKSKPAVTVQSAMDKETKFNYSGMSLTVDTSKPVAIPRDMKKRAVTEERDKAEADPYPPVSEPK
ncbi:MAG: hypothetical protein GX654_03140 [Desulfatiglans sp.]|jgi:capsular polysaccharide biosynthesis protein|nr:hypothetical protein [Desulfatiglans sp.]